MNNYSRAALYLALGLIVAAALLSFNYRAAKRHSDMINQTIRVKGYAEKNITSDYATWTGSINVRSATLNTAYDQLERQRNQVKAFLIGNNVGEEIINFSQINVGTNYRVNSSGYSTNEILDYTLYQNITIESSDLLMVSKIAKDISSLIKEGINISSYSPQYLYTKIEDLKIEMLAEAAANAKERAVKLAENTGSKIGPLTYASQGVFQITPVHSYEVSDYGMFDTQTIEKSIKAVVTMEFAID